LCRKGLKAWKGLSFPGGHVNQGESIVDSAIREIKEETGLDIKKLKSCGVVHWCNSKTFDRYFVFLYKTSDFEGNLITEMDEGKNYWISVDELKIRQTTNDFCNYLPMFFEDGLNEIFIPWVDDEPYDIMYK